MNPRVVRMSNEDRDRLPEYSCSLPTQTGRWGVKRWRRWDGSGWWLGEYIVAGTEQDKLLLRWSRIEPLEEDDGC